MTSEPTHPTPTIRDRLEGAVWGHLAGDALGVPYEFRMPEGIETVEFRGGGGHGQPPGTWSDDGALMLALLDSLTSAGFDPEDQGRKALAWADSGAYAPGTTVFDIGGATSTAMRHLRKGVAAVNAGPSGEHDCGNGSLMRILPVALVGRDLSDAELVAQAQIASRVTHGHPRPQVACALYVLIARDLLRGETDTAAILEACTARYRSVPEAHLEALEELIARRSKVRYGAGYVLDTFWSAWEALTGAASYREAVIAAVKYGHDADTTACITGGLAGIRWGIDGVAEEWLVQMRGREIAEPLVRRLVDLASEPMP